MNYESHGMLDDAQDRLSWLMSRGEFEDAMQFFIENRAQITPLRRRFYLSCILDGLVGHKSYRRIVRTTLIMLAFNFLIQPVFPLKFLDLFAFLSQRFLYYNYFAVLLPNVINALFILGLIFQWHTWVALPCRLFERRVEPAYRIVFFITITLVSAFVAVQFISLAKDLPRVRDGGYLTRTVTEEDVIAMAYGQIIHETDREDVASELRRVLHDEYGWDYYADDYPVYYYKNGKDFLGRDTVLIYLDAEEEYYVMSRLQYKATVYDDGIYPFVIKYLPGSKVILQIVNE
jgi:hypothetical protein